MTGLIILAIIVAVIGYAIFLYNDLVSKRQLKEEGWSGIDVQLKRRTDLIPNLLETVKGYMGHERETLEAVVQARTAATSGANGTPAERSGEEPVAAHHGGWRVTAELGFGEATEPQHLVHQQARRDLAVVHDHDPRAARGRGGAAAEELPQVEDRQDLAAHVGDAPQPWPRARHPGQRRRHAQDLAGLVARNEVGLAGHPQGDPDPFTGGGAVVRHLRRHRATAPLEFGEQVEGLVAQRLEREGIEHGGGFR